MSGEHHDVIIVGAGPSGATAAYELSRAGLRTLLIEKAKLPRYKTCGGGVTYKAARALPFSIDSVSERTLTKVDFSWRTGKPYVVESETPLVYMVQRSRFDQYLVEQAVSAGAHLMDETPVISAEADEHGATVSTTRGRFSADYLIGADGATGRVARSLDLMSDRWAGAALESEVEVDDVTMSYWQDKLGLDLGELRATYGWVFPKGDHLSVGVGGLPLMPDYGSQLKRYDAKHTAARVPMIKRVIRSHGYLLPCRRAGTPVQKGRALLVGDAAGLVEALTGEGIYWAIRSGQIAAGSIVGRGEVLDYQSRLDMLLMPDLLAARRWLGFYVLFPRACYSIPRHIPSVWHGISYLLRGERHFSEIKRRLGPLGFIESKLPDPLLMSRRSQST
ncbi:MAG: geranylgeranyl reductase family protein [Chloroflexia bacterium]